MVGWLVCSFTLSIPPSQPLSNPLLYPLLTPFLPPCGWLVGWLVGSPLSVALPPQPNPVVSNFNLPSHSTLLTCFYPPVVGWFVRSLYQSPPLNHSPTPFLPPTNVFFTPPWLAGSPLSTPPLNHSPTPLSTTLLTPFFYPPVVGWFTPPISRFSPAGASESGFFTIDLKLFEDICKARAGGVAGGGGGVAGGGASVASTLSRTDYTAGVDVAVSMNVYNKRAAAATHLCRAWGQVVEIATLPPNMLGRPSHSFISHILSTLLYPYQHTLSPNMLGQA